MSRSRRKHPCIPWIGGSNKWHKRQCNRKFRRWVKRLIKNNPKGMDLYKRTREVMDVWSFKTDGLACWRIDIDEKYMRK